MYIHQFHNLKEIFYLNKETMGSIELGCKTSYLNLDEDALVLGLNIIPLSRTQVHVIYRLAMHLGQPVRNIDLIHAAWGNNIVVSPDIKKNFYVLMFRIRGSLKANKVNRKLIVTVRGFGYLLRPF